jgi:serine/threonine protein phosphatase 1
MSRTFVMGDIHGAYRALKQCLERSAFDYENDTLICLGDVCDGWPETKQCVDELLKIRKLVYLLGNHDLWGLQWMKGISPHDIWLAQGGYATVESYHAGVPEAHVMFLETARPYFILDNRLFVHAGFDLERPLEDQTTEIFLWDRNLAYLALSLFQKKEWIQLSRFKEIYIGHTPVTGGKPIHSCEVWLLDTGAGWSGPLSMMDIDTKELFLSDNVPLLYPGVSGRRRG